jgi:hypothetical protein
MPSYSLNEIMSLATTDLRRDDFTPSYVSQYVNIAYQEVADQANHALLESVQTSSTTINGSKVTLPADFGDLINVSISWSWSTATSATTSHKTLHEVNRSYVDAAGSERTGTPESYYAWNDGLYLYPSPNSQYTVEIRYRAFPSDMTDGSTIPSMHTAYRYAIVLKTEELLARSVRDIQLARELENDYVTFMLRQKFREARTQTAEGRQGVHVHIPGRTDRVNPSRFFSETEIDRW